MLIDCHCHLAEENSRSDWRWFEGEPEGALPLDRFVAQLAKQPVDHVILSGGTSGVETPEKLAKTNDDVAQAVRLAPGLISGRCQANPHLLDDSLEEMDRHIGRGGFVGVGELCGYIENYETDWEQVFPIIEKAIELDVPILEHASEKAHTDGIDRLAARFPEARFIMAHMGGMFNWPEGLNVARRHDNLWIDTSGFVMLRPGAMQRALAELGPSKILFGVDYPLVTAAPLAAALADLHLPQSDYEQIAFRNAADLFNLDLRPYHS